MAQEKLTLRNEEDAWQLIQLWMDGHPVPRLAFSGWPMLKIAVKGEDHHSSLRSRQMEALIQFQMAMGRAYAAIAHGAYDKRRLRKDEEDQLEFKTTVAEGSSILETDLTPLVNAVSQVVTAHTMESLVASVVVALALVSRPMVLKHFENKAKQMDKDERDKLVDLVGKITADDRRKTELLESALEKLSQKHPAIDRIIPDLSTSYWRFAAASADADYVRFAGVELNSENLEALAERRAVRTAELDTVMDDFVVEGITRIQDFYRVQLHSETYYLSATYRKPQLKLSNVRRLLNCVTNSNKIRAKVEIKRIDKAQVVGRLLEFTVLEVPESDG